MSLQGDGDRPVAAACGGDVISVFDARVERAGEWTLENKRLSGFRRSLMPSQDGATFRLAFTGTGVSLLRGSPWQVRRVHAGQAFGVYGEDVFTRPGGCLGDATMTVRIDGGQPRQIDLADAPVEIPLADDLSDGPHRLELRVNRRSRLPVLGFRVAQGGYGQIRATVNAAAAEYLNDLAVDIYRDGQLIDQRLSRNPDTGQVQLWGLSPGRYDLRLYAWGWQTQWLRGVAVDSGGVTHVGNVFLAADSRATPLAAILSPTRGHPAIVAPGSTLEVVWQGSPQAVDITCRLSRWRKTHALTVGQATFDAAARRWHIRATVPADVPDGMYRVAVSSSLGGDQADAAVCVRRGFGSTFRVVTFGHMDVWTQRNAQYMHLLGELTDMIGADLLLVGNGVNWQYVAGALADVDVPYLINSGNHSLPGYEDYFGSPIATLRAGDVFVVNSSVEWGRDTTAVAEAFDQAGDATFHILHGYDPDLPESLGKQWGVDLYAYGHGFSYQWMGPEDSRAPLPKTPWLHLGKEFHVVTIEPGTQKTSVTTSANRIAGSSVKYPIDRAKPWSPIVYDPANDGQHDRVRATCRNPLTADLTDARVRFVMPAGAYAVDGGRIERVLTSDDGTLVEVLVRVDVPAKGTAEVTLSPSNRSTGGL